MEELNKNIDDIIIRHLLNEASTEEEILLLNWMKSDMANQRHFFQMKDIWTASQANKQNVFETDEFWSSLKAALEKSKIVKMPVNRTYNYSKILKYAALGALLLSIGFAALKYGNRIFRKEVALTYTEIITPDGQKKEVILPDGTEVWINSGTTFKYASNYGKTNREIYLKGEAYFNVTRDTTKTFIVHAENITIKVLGTSFNVMCYPELKTIETTVISGTVSLENSEISEDKKVVILNKKEKATFLKNQQKIYITKNRSKDESKETVDPIELKKISLTEEEADYIASWKDHNLSFNNESFGEMAFKLQRWFNVKIVIEDEKLRNYRYKGKFDNAKSIFQVLEVVRLTTPITYEYNEKTKEITIKELKN